MFHFSPRNALLPSAALAILLGLTACGGGSSDPAPADTTINASGAAAGAAAGTVTTTTTPTPTPTPTPVAATKALGLTDQRASVGGANPGTTSLVAFDIATPNTVVTTRITAPAGAGAFQANEWIFGIDFRPVDGILWGLSNRGRLFTIDPGTAVATFQRPLVADTLTPGFTALDPSTSVSVDFNPAADRMRVVTFVGQNLRINVATGATIEDTPVPPVGTTGFSWVAGVAYTNSIAGATPTTATTLYTINNNRDDLSTQTPPNSGTQVLVGSLGVAIAEVQGFDISGPVGSTAQLALAALATDGAAGPHSLYNINLSTGAATLRGTAATAQIGGPTGLPLVDIAIRP